MGLLLTTSLLKAELFRLEIGGSLFYPSEKAFREIYGPGIKYSVDISRNIWKKIELHVEVSYFYKHGQLTFTGERTAVRIIPWGVHVRYPFLEKKINFYAGAGLIYTSFQEKNPIGRVKGDKLGYTIKIGGFKRIKVLKKYVKEFIIDFCLSYHYCEMRPAEIKFDAGGLDLGLALGYEF